MIYTLLVAAIAFLCVHHLVISCRMYLNDVAEDKVHFHLVMGLFYAVVILILYST